MVLSEICPLNYLRTYCQILFNDANASNEKESCYSQRPRCELNLAKLTAKDAVNSMRKTKNQLRWFTTIKIIF